MRPPPPPPPHFSAGELLRIRSESEFLGCEAEVRLIHHLALLCPRCWAAVDELPPVEARESLRSQVSALQCLGLTPAALGKLGPSNRAAISAARRQPLGFCRVLMEELWLMATRDGLHDGLPDMMNSIFGAILGNGACIFAPREAHDLQGHFFTLLTYTYYWADQRSTAAFPLALAKAHLARGRGEAEPRASLLEVEAALALRQGDRGRGLELLEEARDLLAGYEPADRQAETLLLLGNAIADYRGEENDAQAVGIYRQALAILDQLAPGTNPALRERLNEDLAQLNVDDFLEEIPA